MSEPRISISPRPRRGPQSVYRPRGVSRELGLPTQVPPAWCPACCLTVSFRPFLRFDRSAQDYCYPDEATNSNNGQCAEFNPAAPIYYKIVRCGDFLKLAWHFWYGIQRGCDPLGVDSGHDDDWEHVTVNFVRENQTWTQDSVTFSQHGGHYTRRNKQQVGLFSKFRSHSHVC